MVKKVVFSVMLAAVAALAWQGLTSVPAGADVRTHVPLSAALQLERSQC